VANITFRRQVAKWPGDFSSELVQRVVRMNEKVFAGMFEDPPYSFTDYYERLAEVASIVITAETRGMVIANCVAYPIEDMMYVWILAVLPQVRRHGLARRFMDAIELMAKEQKLATVRVKVYNVSMSMQVLLLNRGYHIVQVVPSPTDSKYNEVYFELRLASST